MASPCFPRQLSRSDLDKLLTPDMVGPLWDYAKTNYIDKGVGFDDMIHGVATYFFSN